MKKYLKRQHGAASLIMSLVILALLTIITIYTSKTILTEQKISNNDVRSRQAFEAAEAGIGEAVAALSTNPDLNENTILDGSSNTEFLFDTNGDGTYDSNSLNIGTTGAKVDVTTADLSATGNFTIIQIIAAGKSDDGTSSRTIYRALTTLNPIPNTPDNPLTTRGTVVVKGSATIYNPEGHSTIWSGGDVDLGSNNSTSTQIADVAAANYPTCMDFSETCPTVQSSNKTTVGLDVIEYDTNLANLNADQFFENFFGTSKSTFKDQILRENPQNVIDASTQDEAAVIDNALSQIMWIDVAPGQKADLGGITVGCSTDVTGTNIGSADCSGQLKPSVIIVDGDLAFSGNSVFYGMVFVTGTVDLNGSTTVIGSMATTGNVGDPTNSTSGSIDIIYNSDVLESLVDAGAFGASAGSWRDFDVL